MRSTPVAVTFLRSPRTLWWLAVFALAGYALFIERNASVAAGGSDTSGYLNNARLLASGHLQTELRVPAEFAPLAPREGERFEPLGFVVLPDNPHLPPTYPTGLPLQLALAGKLFGWFAGPLVVELCSALGVLLLFVAVARELEIDGWLAAAGAVMLAAFPVFLFTSIQPLSDTPATLWCLAAVYAALRARRQTGWAAACGAAWAVAVLVRPTNIVLAPVLLVLLGCRWRVLALFGLAGAPGAAWLAFYNRTLYGGALRSGYGPIPEAFGVEYGRPTLIHFAYWLAVLLPAIVLVLPVLALWRARRHVRESIALVLWFGIITGLYLFYDVSHNTWWCLRFILPAVPALLLLGFMGLRRWPAGARAVTAVVLAAWGVGCSLYWTPRLHPLLMKHYEGLYPKVCDRARAEFPPNTLVACLAASGALYYYTDFATLRWDQVQPEQFARYAALAAQAGRPVGAVLFGGFEDDAFARMPGNWAKIDQVENVTFWRLGPPAGTVKK